MDSVKPHFGWGSAVAGRDVPIGDIACFELKEAAN
jgi:hypothetical protein